jgi:hypothetical protein
MIAVFVREQDTIQLIRCYAASLEAQDELARAQSSIDKNLAMIGRDEGTISGAAAAEHGQTEHARYLAGMEARSNFNGINLARHRADIRLEAVVADKLLPVERRFVPILSPIADLAALHSHYRNAVHGSAVGESKFARADLR